jgi:hypothetical protein
MDDHRIILRADVPTDPDELREWLKEWHKQHNGIETDNRLPGYLLTKKGRQLLALSTSAKN